MQKNVSTCRTGRIKLPLFMLMLCLLAGSINARADEPYKLTKVTLRAEQMEFSKALGILEKAADVQFFYNHSQVDPRRKVTVKLIDRPLEEVINALIKGFPIDVEYLPNRVVVLKFRSGVVPGIHTRKVTGTIIDDETGEPLPGASIVIKENKGMGVVSDAAGKFVFEVPEEVTSLVISFVGYDSYELMLDGNVENRKIRLKQTIIHMEDAVVTGMAPRKVEGFTGSYISVKAEDLKKLNPNNLLSALQVFDPSFRIVENNQRGSDPNAMPEFRLQGDVQLGNVEVDDMTLLMGDYSNRPNMPLFILDGFETTLQQIVDLDPERVESITILKDAAATAIYGSRAANGVIVFETKTLKEGALQISYSTNIGLTIPDLTDYNLMDAEEKLEFEKKAGVFKEEVPALANYYSHYRQEILRGVNTYWLSAPLRTIVTHRHNISVGGGDRALRYTFTANYGSTPGVMKDSDRNSMGLSFRLQYRRKKWNVGNQISLSNTKANGTPYGSFRDYTKLNPYYRKTDENGNYTKSIESKNLDYGSSAVDIVNPLYNPQFPFKDLTENFSVTDNFSLECAILEHLRVNANVSFTKGTAKTEKFKSMNHTSFELTRDMTKKGSYDKSTGESFNWSTNVSVSYNPSIGKHIFNLYGRWEIREGKSNSINLSAKGFPNDNMTDFLFAYEMEKRVSGGESTSRSLGVTGQFNYMYDMRYALDMSIRGDLSSQFGANTNMAPFWSVGVRWNAYREKWLKNTFVSNLTFVGSYGITGSQNYSPYQAMEMYSFSDLMFPYPASDVIGAQLKGVANPDLGWSKTKNRNVRMEIGFWDNRLGFSFNYYNNLTDQLLLSYTLAPSVGFSTMVTNAGSVLNKGYDFHVNITPIRDYKRQISWNLSFNGAHNRNKIKKISNVVKKMNEENLKSTGAPQPIYEEGKSTTQLFTVPSLGLDPESGEEIFLKKTGEKTFVWSAADKVAVGDQNPKMNGAITSNFNYKGLSLNLAFSYQFGGYKYNQTLVDRIENASLLYNLDRRAMEDRWSATNRHAKYRPIKKEGQNTPSSSRFVQKFNEFKFTSIGMGYRMDAQKFKFLHYGRIASINMNFSMQDIARFSTVKQERGLDYPFARTFNLSLSVLFN